MRILTSTCLFLISLANQAGYSRSLSYDELLSQYSGSIRQIFLCGNWREGEVRGIYRITEAYVFSSSFLYVQKLVGDKVTGGMKIISTAPVAPFDDDHAERELSDLQCVLNGTQARVTATSCNQHEVPRCNRQRLFIDLSRNGSEPKVEFR